MNHKLWSIHPGPLTVILPPCQRELLILIHSTASITLKWNTIETVWSSSEYISCTVCVIGKQLHWKNKHLCFVQVVLLKRFSSNVFLQALWVVNGCKFYISRFGVQIKPRVFDSKWQANEIRHGNAKHASIWNIRIRLSTGCTFHGFSLLNALFL